MKKLIILFTLVVLYGCAKDVVIDESIDSQIGGTQDRIEKIQIDIDKGTDKNTIVEGIPIVETHTQSGDGVEEHLEIDSLDTYIGHPEIRGLEVIGYMSSQEREEMFCFENCKKYTYIFFHILSHNSDVIGDFLEQEQGNSYVSGNAIGLGCLNNEAISRMNQSDEFGMKEYTDTIKNSKILMNSSQEEPVTMSINKYLFTGGSGAPDCYSHFADIEFIK